MPCYCSQCFPSRPLGIRTISQHLKADQDLLTKKNHAPELQRHLEFCIQQNVAFLESTNKGINLTDQTTRSRSSTQAHAQDNEDYGPIDNDYPMGNQEYDNDHVMDDGGYPTDDQESDDNHSDVNLSDELLQFPEEIMGPDLRPNESESTEADEGDFYIPHTLQVLRDTLLGGYTLPVVPPASASPPRGLGVSEMLSLKHYVAWAKSNGTVEAYKLHAQVLQDATSAEILTLHSARKLATDLTQLHPLQIDICPQTCIAYTGEFEQMESCPYIHDGKICGQPRYKPKGQPSAQNKPYAQMMYLPVMASIKAMFANAETSRLLRYRDKCLQEALGLMATAAGKNKYSDFGNSKIHIHHHQNMNLFQEPRNIALALSTDGAQLTMKKQSDTWLLIIIFLNLPPEIRCKSRHFSINLATPGPRPPGHMESFAYPVFEEMAMASEGIWTWDAVDSSYFVNRAYICMVLGDMLGSAKFNGMAGHSAIYGDRFSMVRGARASLAKGAKPQYYAISPPQSSKYNPERPLSYNLDDLPMRREKDYWETIEKLHQAGTKAARNRITKETGISRMPLCASSYAYVHPTFFPIDPFHLFYENCMAFLWDTWTTHSKSSEPIHLHPEKARRLGLLVSEAMSTLPPSFCGPVRDPFLKRQSQYKIYEWMALLHWYIVPVGIEIGMSPAALQNFSHFVEAVEFAMTIRPQSDEELLGLHNLIKKFLIGFEKLYIDKDPEKVSRFRLCLFQLIHVPKHIEWNGSIRLGSQATVERAIGETGHKIRSKKAPFANMANIICERELVKLLLLYYPILESHPPLPSEDMKLLQEIKILKRERASSESFLKQLHAICLWLERDFDSALELHRWGKFRVPRGAVLRSQLSETRGKLPARVARYFEAEVDGKVIFGEALAFFEVVETHQFIIVYHPLVKINKVLNMWRGVWSDNIEVLPVSALHGLVGIWCSGGSENIYVLRKHPGLSILNQEECEQEVGNDES